MFLDRHFRHPIRRPASGSPPWLIGLVFVLGLVTGSLTSAGGHLPGNLHSAAASADSPIPASAPPGAPLNWSRDGNPGVRHVVDVLRVIDGDTFEARVHLWPGLEMTTRVRLRGIDAPEMKGACAEEIRMAEVASEALRAQLADGDVAIFNIGPDKYSGRVVADAATWRTPSISTALLASGHAWQYRGGRRGGWCGTAFKAG